jgi:hypothetical protein
LNEAKRLNAGNAQIALQRSAPDGEQQPRVGAINLEEIAHRSLVRNPDHSGRDR